MPLLLDDNQFHLQITKNGIIKENDNGYYYHLSPSDLLRLKQSIDQTYNYYLDKKVTDNKIKGFNKRVDNAVKKAHFKRADKYQKQNVEESMRFNLEELGLHLYLIHNVGDNMLKIGKSHRPKQRLANLKTAHHAELEMLYIIKDQGHTERDVHNMFMHLNVKNEWFKYHKSIIEFFEKKLQNVRK